MGEPLVGPFVREQKFGPVEAALWIFQQWRVTGPCGWPKALGAEESNRQTSDTDH